MGDKKTKPVADPNLIGEKVYLRPATSDDIINMHHWAQQCSPASLSCHARPFGTAAEAAERYKKAEKTAWKERLAVVRIKDKTPVGLVSFFGYNHLNRSAELGLLIDPDEQKKGYGSDAIKIISRYLFHYRGLNKVHAQTAGFNKAATALLASLGFKRDAILRDHYYHDGEFHSGYIYSLLRFEADW